MELYLTIAVIGIIATAIMTLFLYMTRALTKAHVDMILAIGTLFTHDMKRAYRIGLTIHFIAGIVFAFIYLGLASYFGFNSKFDFLVFGSIIGLAHGTVISILMVVLVAEHHPLAQFREAGFRVVAAQGLAHVIYGFSIGATTAMLHPNLELMPIFGTGIM